MTSSNSTKQTQYEKPKGLSIVIFMLGVISLAALISLLVISPPLIELDEGNTIELEGGQSASVITLDGQEGTVNLEKQDESIESATVEIKKYYTNDILLEDGKGKASVGTSLVNKETIKIEDNKKTIQLNNKNNKNTAIIVLDLQSYQGTSTMLKIFLGTLILLFLSILLLFVDKAYYKFRNKNLL